MGIFDIPPVEEEKVDSALVAVFREIWEEREHKSEVSGAPLHYEFDPGMFFVFSHLHSRGACPALKLEKENIMLMTELEHKMWEFYRHKLDPEGPFSKVFNRFNQLKPLCNQINKS